MSAPRCCARCGSAVCDGRTIACMGCGTEQCHGNGLGRGSCSVCYYGILPGWSGSDKLCGYKGCTGKAAFHYVPGGVKFVCLGCAHRPKIARYGLGGGRSVKVALDEHVAEAVSRALACRGVVQPGEVAVRRT